MKPTVVVTRRIPAPALEMLAAVAALDANEADRAYTRSELLAHVAEAHALVALLTDRVDDEVFAAAPQLRIVANVAVGYDNIDVAAAARRGIVVTNTPGVLTDATADFALALLLAIARRVPEADRFVRAGSFREWMMMGFHGAELAGRTLGVAGFGRIGRAVAQRARAFGMQVIYTANGAAPAASADALDARRVDKAALIAESDVLSLHVPLTARTRHYLGAPEFAAMKSTAYVINTARGPVIDEEALVRALETGAIRGAALDVFEREPEVHPGLLALENVVLAPHIASATVETRTKIALMAAENVIAVLAGGVPPNPVRADAG